MPARRNPSLGVWLAALCAAVACDSQSSESASSASGNSAAVAQVIDSLETSNDSTQRVLDATRVQLDTALQSMLDISTLLDRLAGERIQIASRPSPTVERAARENIAALRRRSVAQLDVLRKRLQQLTSDLQTVRDTTQRLTGEVARLTLLVTSMTQRRDAQEARLTELTAAVARLTAERDTAVQRNAALVRRADTLRHTLDSTIARTEARDDSVFYLIGDAVKLRELRVAESVGGILGIGKTLRLRSDFPKNAFTVWSKRASAALPMPRADRQYRVISAQRQSCYSWSGAEKEARTLRVHDVDCFWEPGRFLVIEEHK